LIPKARTAKDVFNAEYQEQKDAMTWRTYRAEIWASEIRQYILWGWKLIPIAVRQKLPIRSQSNYRSRGALGPYLSLDEAIQWTKDDFNLAVVAGPSNLIILDADDPELWAESGRFLKWKTMRTPRGFAIPMTREGVTREKIDFLKKRGYDFREDVAYELVPNSQTCIHDHDLHGRSHPGPRDPCLEGSHDYRIREWIGTNRIASFAEFWEMWQEYV
jgi:hypothetical protein